MKRTRIEWLLNDLCVDLGFCLPPDEYARLLASPPDSVQAFTNAVFMAEGLDPQFANKHLWRAVQDRVTKYFEAEEFNDVV